VERADASDVVILPPGGSLIVGRQAHMRLFEESFKRFTMIFDNKSEEIVVSGDWGFDRGTYRYTETPIAGGVTVVIEGNYLWLARREQDGMWRYARIIWNTREPTPQNDER
jgi:ketosteroid isomerase-like protein